MTAGSEGLKPFTTSRRQPVSGCLRLLGDVTQVGAIDQQISNDLRAASAELVERLRTTVSVCVLEDRFQCLFRRLHSGPGRTVGDLDKGRCFAAVGKCVPARGIGGIVGFLYGLIDLLDGGSEVIRMFRDDSVIGAGAHHRGSSRRLGEAEIVTKNVVAHRRTYEVRSKVFRYVWRVDFKKRLPGIVVAPVTTGSGRHVRAATLACHDLPGKDGPRILLSRVKGGMFFATG